LPNSVNQVIKVKMPIDIELLIELYRSDSEEGLWDSSNANYLNVDVRQAALRHIADRLGSEVTGGIKLKLSVCDE